MTTKQPKKTTRQLELENRQLDAKNKALLIERRFWVDQGAMLQNQLQTWQKMYADMFDQLGRGVVTDESVAENLALAAEELRQPIAAVAAVEAAFSMLKADTQGQYTAVGRHKRGTESLLDFEDGYDDTP